MKQRSFLLILCLIFISFGVALVSAQQQCMNRGNYGSNSTYDKNLRLILSYLPSNVTAQDGFFYNGSIGQEPDRVFAIGMCIPGSTSDDCSDCIKTASGGLIQSCPNQVEAYSWTSEPTLCLVRYSKTYFFGSADLDQRNLVYDTTGDISSNLSDFKEIMEDLVVRMIHSASKAKSTPSSSKNHYIVDVAALTASENIYVLMQCTPDVSSRDCETCLRHQSCCGQNQGGVIMMPACFFRWDSNAFSKAFDNIKVASPSPPLQPPSKNGSRRATVAIVVPIVVVFFIIIIVVLLVRRSALLCWRRKPSQQFDLYPSRITNVRSLQLDFKAIVLGKTRNTRMRSGIKFPALV